MGAHKSVGGPNGVEAHSDSKAKGAWEATGMWEATKL